MSSSRLYSSEWQHVYLGVDCRWNMAFLHLIGRPIPAADWERVVEGRDCGLSPAQAVAAH